MNAKQLNQCIASGQVSARQTVAHHAAGEYESQQDKAARQFWDAKAAHLKPGPRIRLSDVLYGMVYWLGWFSLAIGLISLALIIAKSVLAYLGIWK